MSKEKNLIDKMKVSEAERSKISNDGSIDFLKKTSLIRKSVLDFQNSLTKEEMLILESDSFFDLLLRWKQNREPKTRYEEYLLSPEWNIIKSKVIKRAKYKCEGCGEDHRLEVHHLTYDRIGDELMIDLAALCNYCHGKVHGKITKSSWGKYLSEVKNETKA